MREYGVPFHEIETQWTEEQFQLFLRRIQARKAKEAKALQKARGNRRSGSNWQRYT